MSLTETLSQWALLRRQLDDLELSIQSEVIALGKTQSYEDVVAEYRKSSCHGKYDYEKICQELEPDMELVKQFTVHPEPYIDYVKLADAAGANEELKKKYYTPPAKSEPKVTIKFKK